jgi:hypothetical protein
MQQKPFYIILLVLLAVFDIFYFRHWYEEGLLVKAGILLFVGRVLEGCV